MLDACGVVALADPTVVVAFGERVLLSHGDALCLDDVDVPALPRRRARPGMAADFLSRPIAERRAMARAIARRERAAQGARRPLVTTSMPMPRSGR